MVDETHTYDALISAARDDLVTPNVGDAKAAEKRLKALRDFTEFDLIIALAERYILEWPDAADLRKFYGQALIDTGRPRAGLAVLQTARDDIGPDHPAHDDICGVLGRAHKDLFLQAHASGKDPQAKFHAQAAFDAYYFAYTASERRTYDTPEAKKKDECDLTYQGINTAALIALSNDEGVEISGAPKLEDLAEKIIATLADAPDDDPWAAATLAEANLPLRKWDDAEKHLGNYLKNPNLTRFQVAGTLRQFRDVWRLGDAGKRGRQVLAVLDAAHASVEKGFGNAQVNVPMDGNDTEVPPGLEKILGDCGMKTYKWLKDGFARAESVASVLNAARRRIGTAFVIDPAEFGLTVPDGHLCLMTNFHVINTEGVGDALRLTQRPRLRFEANGDTGDTIFKVTDILFESPFGGSGLDCCIVIADAKGHDIPPVPLEPDIMPDLASTSPPRVYIIGHPLGGEMQFSLQDNKVLDHEGEDTGTPPVPSRRRIHYFAPTEPGNSGSPVFDEWWNCIALHHAGLKHDPAAGMIGMPMLNGKPGHHSANEGIAISSIIEAVRNQQD